MEHRIIKHHNYSLFIHNICEGEIDCYDKSMDRVAFGVLEYLNSVVTIVTYVYKTINTRSDTIWSAKLSLFLTKPSK